MLNKPIGVNTEKEFLRVPQGADVCGGAALQVRLLLACFLIICLTNAIYPPLILILC